MGWLDQFEDWPPYRWLWERVGGRPWTHIARDWCRDHTLAYSALCLGLGYLLAAAPSTLAVAGGVLLLAIVLGHLWV